MVTASAVGELCTAQVSDPGPEANEAIRFREDCGAGQDR